MTQSLYKKFNMTNEEFKTYLQNLYYEEKLSQAKIAKKLNCWPTTIEDYFHKYGFKCRTLTQASRNYKTKTVKITNKQKSIIEGWLLSDGSLSKSNTGARFTIGLKFKEPINNLIGEMQKMNFTPIWQSPKTKCFHVKTHTYANLTDYYERWYFSGKKEVPENFFSR